jgi:cytochrome d ubiquinol oxidase subunit I
VLVPGVLPAARSTARGRARRQGWEEAYYLWTKIFALSFALGVVSGITMSFQFGTNWPGYMERAGNIAGPLLGYEVLTAFFLEATFLGDHAVRPRPRVGPGAPGRHADGGARHDAVGLLDPQPELVDADATGYEIIDGRFHATSWSR